MSVLIIERPAPSHSELGTLPKSASLEVQELHRYTRYYSEKREKTETIVDWSQVESAVLRAIAGKEGTIQEKEMSDAILVMTGAIQAELTKDGFDKSPDANSIMMAALYFAQSKLVR